MKVKDLILRLQECPPDNIVILDGYEGGVGEIRDITANVKIALNVNTQWYYGKHEVLHGDGFPDADHANATHIHR